MAICFMFACFGLLIGSNAVADSNVSVEVSRIGDATHLEFTGSSDWKYDFKRDASKNEQVTLRLPGVKTEALNKLRGHSDALIKSVVINEKGLDNAAEITFQLSSRSDYFDYISDQPSKLIIDFFPKEAAVAHSAPKPQAAALPEKTPAEKKPEPKAAKVASRSAPQDQDDKDDDGADSDEVAENETPAHALPKKGARTPAGTDLVIAAKGVLPPPPSLAERISSKKDFSHGIFDGGDPEFKRFTVKDYEIKEDSIIASRANFYLPFPILDLGTPQLKALLAVPPTYEIIANDTRENKEARVLLSLFSTNQRALFLKAAGEFVEEHPNSPYDEIVRYMIADAHNDIFRASNSIADFETAMNSYLALAEKYPSSPMTQRTLLLMGNSYLDRGDSFGALKAFQRFTRLFPDSKHIDRVHISIAGAYLTLNRFDDAYGLFDQIEKSGKSEKGREEAAFRKGDVFFRKKDFARAVDEYKSAAKRFPAAVGRFPNAPYNTAESEFNLKRYKESLETYRAFLQKFPDHEHGGYAMTRMGELLGILGAEPATRALGAFMESGFRYRGTPGAGVARIRLLTSRMTEMKEKELASALQEIDEITRLYANRPKSAHEAEAKTNDKKAEGGHGSGKSAEHGGGHEVAETTAEPGSINRLVPREGEDPTRKKPELPGIEEFSTLLIADGMTARHEYDKAVQDLIAFYQKNPQSPNKDRFKDRIVRNLSEGIRASVEKGDFIDALRRYSKHSDGWLKNTDRIDVRYDVGRAYEQAGVGKEASKVYEDCLKRLAAIKGSKAEREHAIFESLPKAETVELRLAAVAARDKDFARAEARLKKISDPSRLAESEQIERAEVAAQVAEARGQPEAARRYLTELIGAWKGDPQLTSPLHLRIARLQAGEKNFKAADQHLAKIMAWKKEDGARVSDDVHAQALELRGDLFVKRGKRGDAARSYRELLTAYEASRPLASVRYRLGQVLYQDGDLKGAESVWKDLKPEKDNIWQRLAVEQMQGAKWQNEYKKYLNRIPAAAELRDSTPTSTSR